MTLKQINTSKAPTALGPYSQAIQIGNMLYLSGQIGLNPTNMNLVEGIENQTNLICKNIGEILKTAGTDFKNVIKTTIFLTNINDFKIVNEIYEKYFISKPARSSVQINALPKGALIEIETIAYIK